MLDHAVLVRYLPATATATGCVILAVLARLPPLLVLVPPLSPIRSPGELAEAAVGVAHGGGGLAIRDQSEIGVTVDVSASVLDSKVRQSIWAGKINRRRFC